MVDVVDHKTRSRMMAGIRGKNTKPELVIRQHLHRRGFRFRLHDSKLPGKPDMVLKKYHAVIFVHGCFWHKHNCHLFKWPKTRSAFWKRKIEKNSVNDEFTLDALRHLKWRVCVVWECALKGKKRKNIENIIDDIAKWLLSDDDFLEIAG